MMRITAVDHGQCRGSAESDGWDLSGLKAAFFV